MLRALEPDALVVAAYGFLLPAQILAIPRLGCINVHASILPRWRGAAPVHHAILAGDRQTGVSIMQMDVGLDTGPILETRTCAIVPEDTTGSLTQPSRRAWRGGTPRCSACLRRPHPATAAPGRYVRDRRAQALEVTGRDRLDAASHRNRTHGAGIRSLARRAHIRHRRRHPGIQGLARGACGYRRDRGAGHGAPLRRNRTGGRNAERRHQHHRTPTAGRSKDDYR